jgi:hypothetical protein
MRSFSIFDLLAGSLDLELMLLLLLDEVGSLKTPVIELSGDALARLQELCTPR